MKAWRRRWRPPSKCRKNLHEHHRWIAETATRCGDAVLIITTDVQAVYLEQIEEMLAVRAGTQVCTATAGGADGL